MKTAICIAGLFLFSCAGPGRAQGLLGFFHQQANKKKLMLAQVAALTVFDHQHAIGYAIDDHGLTDAGGNKGAELAAHQHYYASLSQVRPIIFADAKKKVLHDDQARIGAAFTGEISWQRKHRGLTSKEFSYLNRVAEDIRQRCAADVAEMQAVATPGRLKMTDAERLDRLDRLAAVMEDKYAFTMSFTGKCRKLALARMAERQDQDVVRKLYGN